MPPVFGRYIPDPHTYYDALTEMRASTVEEKAVAINLMYDHRVSVERERAFDAFVKHPCTAFGLRKALKDYFEEKVRERKLPHYVYSDVNACNLLNGQPGVRPLIKPETKLIRVLDLNGLKGVFQWAQTERKYRGRWGRTFDRFPPDMNDRAVMDFLDEKMESRSVVDFVGTVLDVLNEHRLEKKPFQPTWATMWSAFRDYVDEGPDRWHQVLGMDKPSSCWLVLLRYTVREAGTVARPTQLDSGWYQFHFPSPPPPNPPLSTGGHPMDLKASADRVLPEYVHKQIRHLPEHWTVLAPNNYGRTTAPPLPALADERKIHHRLLIHHYGPSVRSWMNDPI
ncbi:MAG TPA: hypothetical protein VEX60_12000 [Pyrinomonadaceae bacterium]|nr:hypothetical protein [Pyrinomonadaceae bacterium]